MTHISSVIKDNVNGGTFIAIDTRTAVALTGGKKNPLKGRVNKVTVGSNVMIFQNKIANGYENMVERRLKNEGKNPTTFKLSPRVWGTRLPDSPFVEHKDNHYLEVIFLKCGNVYYEVDGIRTPRHTIQGLPDEPQTPKQGGLDDKVVIRVYNINSITRMVIGKNEYTNIQY
ncbi:MAG: hypothetical protein KAS32_06520 [Candidatus Peribacteraceae bacterium]|nr:hypothetical protein [Candidatus Peribacteraceae bacterium]